MSTGERAAGGLEALQREWRTNEACERVDQRFGNKAAGPNRKLWKHCADALAPHIAAAKRAKEVLAAAKLLALQTNKPDNELIDLLDELAAILGGK